MFILHHLKENITSDIRPSQEVVVVGKSHCIDSLWHVWRHRSGTTLTRVTAALIMVSWRHQAISWSNVDLSSIRSCSTQLMGNIKWKWWIYRPLKDTSYLFQLQKIVSCTSLKLTSPALSPSQHTTTQRCWLGAYRQKCAKVTSLWRGLSCVSGSMPSTSGPITAASLISR